MIYSLFYKRIENYIYKSDLSNLQVFFDHSKEYRVPSNHIIGIKRNIRIMRFKILIHSIGELFLKKKKKKKKKKKRRST